MKWLEPKLFYVKVHTRFIIQLFHFHPTPLYGTNVTQNENMKNENMINIPEQAELRNPQLI